MKTKFYISPEEDEAKKHIEVLKSQKRELIPIEGMHFTLEPFGPCFTYYGHTKIIPSLLRGVTITQVVLEDDNAQNFPHEGTYKRGTTFAVVDTGFGAPASGSPRTWYMTVTGKTLTAVVRMYDDIRSGKLQPNNPWTIPTQSDFLGTVPIRESHRLKFWKRASSRR